MRLLWPTTLLFVACHTPSGSHRKPDSPQKTQYREINQNKEELEYSEFMSIRANTPNATEVMSQSCNGQYEVIPFDELRHTAGIGLKSSTSLQDLEVFTYYRCLDNER